MLGFTSMEVSCEKSHQKSPYIITRMFEWNFVPGTGDPAVTPNDFSPNWRSRLLAKTSN